MPDNIIKEKMADGFKIAISFGDKTLHATLNATVKKIPPVTVHMA